MSGAEAALVACIGFFIAVAVLKPTLKGRSNRLLIIAKLLQGIALAIIATILVFAGLGK